MNQIIIQWETTNEPHVQGTFAYIGTGIDSAILDWERTIRTKVPSATIMMLYHSRYQERLFPSALPALLETNLSALVGISNLFHHLHYLFGVDDDNLNEIAKTFEKLATQFDKIREGTKTQ